MFGFAFVLVLLVVLIDLIFCFRVVRLDIWLFVCCGFGGIIGFTLACRLAIVGYLDCNSVALVLLRLCRLLIIGYFLLFVILVCFKVGC